MEIRGKLRDDILNGNAVLFLGAGTSMAAGLHGGRALANYLFKETDEYLKFDKYKDDLVKIVLKIDNDPQFTRRWVNEKLKQYFFNNNNYQNIEWHKKLLNTNWKAIFTTNYDTVVERAANEIVNNQWRLLPISNPANISLIRDINQGKLKYFKIHGCIDDIDKNPQLSPPLVITNSDFINSIRRNSVFWNELEGYALNCSIIFLGFNAQRTENNHILSSIFEAQQATEKNFQQSYHPFAVLRDVDEDTKEEIKDARINLIEGSFEEFVEELEKIKENKSPQTEFSLEETIAVQAAKNEIKINIEEYNQQFFFYYNDFFKQQKAVYDSLIPEKKIDAWKSHPSWSFIYSGNWFIRSQFKEVYQDLCELLNEIADRKSSRILIITGKRAAGKTMFVHQLAYESYQNLNNPILFLNTNANYIEKSQKTEKENLISGWNSRLVDKFLSLFHSENTNHTDLIPIIIADHVSHRQTALDHLLKHLANHGKPSLLILTLNEDESDYETDNPFFEKTEKLSQFYKNKRIILKHKLDDIEIDSLFLAISRNFTNISLNRNLLISRAKDEEQADRDLLLILYQWFDKQFRRLDEIILDEANKLVENSLLKDLYLSVTAFYQYNITPPMPVCVRAAGLSIQDYEHLKNTPQFRNSIDLLFYDARSNEEYGFSRHPEYSRKIFEHLCSEKGQQVEIIKTVLKECRSRDLLFVRDFFNYLYQIDVSFTVENVKEFKEATELSPYLKIDPVLNHQFGAFLIRENSSLKDARYYLDLALEEDPNNSSVIHSIGHLYNRIFRNSLEIDDNISAIENYEKAKGYFEKIRALNRTPDEHGYVTEILMTRLRCEKMKDLDIYTRALLTAESEALFFEAITVVPKENQNYLTTICHSGKKFKELSDDKREILLEKINLGYASGTLIQYYAQDLMDNPKPKNWLRLKELVFTYFTSNDPKILIPIAIISKKAFIISAETRFERLRVFFDDLVRYRQEDVSFVLVSEYVRLLTIDAFVLGKYSFILNTISDIRDKLFIRNFPRFLRDEYILENRFYTFNEADIENLQNYFSNNSKNFINGDNAKLFTRLVNIGALINNFINIEIDPSTRFWVKAIRKEIATSSIKGYLTFKIKHAWDGLKATEFKA